SPPAGYSIAYTFGNNPFYFAVAYHPKNPNMGIVCKFSAYAWSEYCSNWSYLFNRRMDIKKFADLTNVDGYISRFSRVDFSVDYQNFDTTVDQIYSSINKGEIEIRNHKGIKNNSKTNGFFQDEFQTFYIGSRKKNSRLFLRVYDKKIEQLENPSFRYEEALNVDSWVRFECVFKSKYAHDITDMLREEVDDSEDSLMAFIAGKLLEKYQFFNVKEDNQIEFTSELVKIYDTRNTEYSQLRIENPRNSDLMQSINYIVLNS
ncbi:replication initiation factor domain-containing protein, partial [Apilactobacillus sp. F1]|nr:replication initiation factor domain-containing protein [Apilactobacillus sp. F1]